MILYIVSNPQGTYFLFDFGNRKLPQIEKQQGPRIQCELVKSTKLSKGFILFSFLFKTCKRVVNIYDALSP